MIGKVISHYKILEKLGESGTVRKLTDDVSATSYLQWSPDEKWMTYSARPGNEPDDSLRVFLLQADAPAQPRVMGRGIWTRWYSQKEFVIRSPAGTQTGSIDQTG